MLIDLSIKTLRLLLTVNTRSPLTKFWKEKLKKAKQYNRARQPESIGRQGKA